LSTGDDGEDFDPELDNFIAPDDEVEIYDEKTELWSRKRVQGVGVEEEEDGEDEGEEVSEVMVMIVLKAIMAMMVKMVMMVMMVMMVLM
jgi:hypothetical protein